MAKIKEQDIDTLRDSANIVEIVSAYTQLKKAGGQTYKGLCPFHSEKTPSFSVDATRNVYFCFGCSEGGNIYHFVQKMENLPFPEAVEWLARKVGFELHYEEMRPGEQKAYGEKARVLAANEAAADFFHDVLMTSPDAGEARTYLSSRGFGKEVAERWKLGYAPGRDALTKHLLSKRFSAEEITKADLGRKSDRDGSLYDRFRSRVIFPTWNAQGQVVAFGARALGDEQPKYLNTSETPVFSKSRVMYGLDRAKSALGRGAAAIVVEGYTDVIALHEAGVDEAVATNGVALADSHFEMLKKFTSRAVLMFDADDAGKNATERGFGIHHRIGLEVLVAPLPAGRDPADVVTEDGPEGIRKVIEAAQPLLQFKLEQTISKLPLDTPEARSVAVREAVQVLSWHPDPIARHEYAFMVAQRIGVDPVTVQREIDENRAPSESVGGTTGSDRDRRLPGHVKVEREALQLLLTRTQEAGSFVEGLDESYFTAPPRRDLFRKGIDALAQGHREVHARQADDLSPDARSLFTELVITAGESDPASGRFEEVFMRLRVFRLERDISERRKVLQEINPLEDAQRHDQLFAELVGLEAERRDLLKRVRESA